MDIEVARTLLGDIDQRHRDVAVPVLLIVAALKRQPGFDVPGFEMEMLETAAKYPEAEFDTLRLMLEMAGGKLPPDEPK